VRCWCGGGRAAACPGGRRTAADILLYELKIAVIRLQRVCGLQIRGRFNRGDRTMVRRGRNEADALRNSLALCAISTLPTVTPSLRAHEPNPAGL
jgi:hypothetical protein